MSQTSHRDAIARPQTMTSRRQFLLATIGGAITAGFARAADPGVPASTFDKELEAVQARLAAAGIKGARSSTYEFYEGIGNSSDRHRNDALKICYDLSTVYIKHFQDRRFRVEAPKRKLIVVSLKDRKSYEAFSENAPGAEVGGHYDLETNALVVFDFRQDKEKRATSAQRINTFTLVHESLHQLMYNTGLLSRQSDVPVAISEGLAAYGELWQSSAKRAPFGRVNMSRLQVLKDLRSNQKDAPTVESLLTKDDLFGDEDSSQAAYAQSWLLVHYFMRPDHVDKFRAYLIAVNTRTDASHRLEDAKTHLGDLNKLDASLRRYQTQQSR